MQQVQKTEKNSSSKVVLVIALIALAGCAGSLVMSMVNARSIPKIGIVDNTVLLMNFADAITARQHLDVEKTRWQNNIQAIEDSAKKSFEAMRLGYDKASAQERQDMEKRLERWNMELGRYSRAVDDMTKQKENELLKPVIDRLNAYVKMWATRHGYEIILGTGAGGVILSAIDQVNLTGRILEDLNKYYGKSQPASAAEGDTTLKAKTSNGVKDSSTVGKTR